jgi:predicted DCC family thiol-disulfide oxidoreductase YuxK
MIMGAILLFDGDCPFCNRSVQWIIRRDPKGYFSFASLQSERGKQLLRTYGIGEHLDSLVLIDDHRWYVKSEAVLRICGKLKGTRILLIFLYLLPRPVRDFFYDWMAKNRYKWFGKQESCMLPPPEMRDRFLE